MTCTSAHNNHPTHSFTEKHAVELVRGCRQRSIQTVTSFLWRNCSNHCPILAKSSSDSDTGAHGLVVCHHMLHWPRKYFNICVSGVLCCSWHYQLVWRVKLSSPTLKIMSATCAWITNIFPEQCENESNTMLLTGLVITLLSDLISKLFWNHFNRNSNIVLWCKVEFRV